jgi:uncharacterized damage-inducible protein DinB
VPDHKPPKLVDGELPTLQALLQFQRESMVRKLDGISDEQARQRLVGTDTTLLWLLKHLAGAESAWVERRFAGLDRPARDDTIRDGDTVRSAIDAYRATWARVDAIVAAGQLDDPCRTMEGDEQVSLRWILMHLLEETARHAGHADILRELIDGRTGR